MMVTSRGDVRGWQAAPRTRVAVERAPRMMLVTADAGLIANLRPTAEAMGWSVVPATESGATPEMVACCEVVMVDIDLGLGLVRRLSALAAGRLVAVSGGWDLQATEIAPWVAAVLHYPLRDGELAALLARAELSQSSR